MKRTRPNLNALKNNVIKNYRTRNPTSWYIKQ